MAEEKQEEPLWKQFMSIVEKWEYGSIHTHEEIGIALDMIENTPEYYRIIRRTNKQLETMGRKLVSIRKQGYQVLEPDGYSLHSTSIFHQGVKKIRKAKEILQYAPVKHMTKEGQEIHRKVLDRVESFAANIDGGLTEIKLLQNINVEVNGHERHRIPPNKKEA